MKIVTWNCNGALRKKYEALEEFDADVLVVQECEDPALSTSVYSDWAGNYLWTGKNKNKGIGVFPRNGVALEKLDWPDDDLQQFLPCRISDSFNLLGVWTIKDHDTSIEYIEQFWQYLQLNKERMSDCDFIACGDFNSNAVWDKPSRCWNHSDVVRELAEMGTHSLYHEVTGEGQGEETQPTLFLQKKREKPYHIDYAFVSKSMLESADIEVGRPEHWLEISDHMPIVFTIAVEV